MKLFSLIVQIINYVQSEIVNFLNSFYSIWKTFEVIIHLSDRRNIYVAFFVLLILIING